MDQQNQTSVNNSEDQECGLVFEKESCVHGQTLGQMTQQAQVIFDATTPAPSISGRVFATIAAAKNEQPNEIRSTFTTMFLGQRSVARKLAFANAALASVDPVLAETQERLHSFQTSERESRGLTPFASADASQAFRWTNLPSLTFAAVSSILILLGFAAEVASSTILIRKAEFATGFFEQVVLAAPLILLFFATFLACDLLLGKRRQKRLKTIVFWLAAFMSIAGVFTVAKIYADLIEPPSILETSWFEVPFYFLSITLSLAGGLVTGIGKFCLQSAGQSLFPQTYDTNRENQANAFEVSRLGAVVRDCLEIQQICQSIKQQIHDQAEAFARLAVMEVMVLREQSQLAGEQAASEFLRQHSISSGDSSDASELKRAIFSTPSNNNGRMSK